VRVISRKKLVEFWRRHPKSEQSLRAWFSRTRKAKWTKFPDVLADYNSADQVGRFVVFNIGGNKYRLIAAIHYNRQIVFIRYVLTHKEYDDGDWNS